MYALSDYGDCFCSLQNRCHVKIKCGSIFSLLCWRRSYTDKSSLEKTHMSRPSACLAISRKNCS